VCKLLLSEVCLLGPDSHYICAADSAAINVEGSCFIQHHYPVCAHKTKSFYCSNSAPPLDKYFTTYTLLLCGFAQNLKPTRLQILVKLEKIKEFNKGTRL